MGRKVIKSFNDLERDWDKERPRHRRLVTIKPKENTDNLFFWFWLVIGIVLLFIFPISGIIMLAFWAVIFRHKIKRMLKQFLQQYRRY